MELRYKKKINRTGLKLTFLSLPFVVFVLAFFYVPLFGWYTAFVRYKPGIGIFESPFMGLEYFRVMLKEWKVMLSVLTNTLGMSFLMIIASVLPPIFAILLSELPFRRFKRTVQTVTTLPNFISWMIVYALAFVIFSTDGLLDQLLVNVGLAQQSPNLLSNGNTIWFFMTGLEIWKTLGWNAIIYLAAIAGVDAELYDAASVDGAGRFRRMWHITVPGVLPTFVVLLLLQVGNLLSIGLDKYVAFNNPLVAGNIEIIDHYVYRMGLVQQNYSFATAVGIMKTFVSVILLFSVNTLAKRIRGESII
jgi:ABC-type polysaccharide transport system permease subunit